MFCTELRRGTCRQGLLPGHRAGCVVEGHLGRLRLHRYALVYDRGQATLEWHMDGKLLKRETRVPELGPSLLALGMMTEKDIVPGKGSVSCHGQGAVATWGAIRVKTEAG